VARTSALPPQKGNPAQVDPTRSSAASYKRRKLSSAKFFNTFAEKFFKETNKKKTYDKEIEKNYLIIYFLIKKFNNNYR
jgi:hypothetical protein